MNLIDEKSIVWSGGMMSLPGMNLRLLGFGVVLVWMKRDRRDTGWNIPKDLYLARNLIKVSICFFLVE